MSSRPSSSSTGSHVLAGAEGELRSRPLSAWRETGHLRGGSQQKVGILRLPAEVLDRVRELPAEHAI
jgi:hypothetical protein